MATATLDNRQIRLRAWTCERSEIISNGFELGLFRSVCVESVKTFTPTFAPDRDFDSRMCAGHVSM